MRSTPPSTPRASRDAGRRRCLAKVAATLSTPLTVTVLAGWSQRVDAAQKRSLDDPMRLAVDDALMDSGFARALQRGFGRDTGVAVTLLRGPATSVLEALERGEHDAAMVNAPDAEAALEKKGLVHDRRPVAASSFVLVGPAALAQPLGASRDVVTGLQRLAQVQAPFLTAGDGSGAHRLEQLLWRQAKLAPASPWYFTATGGQALLAQARKLNACTLMERGAWLSQAAAGYSVLSEGEPLLSVPVHVMRSFRVHHPAAKLFADWITGPKGRRLASAQRGYTSLR